MLKVSGRLLVLVAPLWLAATCPPLAAADDLAAPAEAFVEGAWPADGPGAAVIVTRGGEVVYAGTRGLADVGTGRPITLDTAFRLGSITKQFTAALVLKLVDEGRISLDDPLSKFLPDFPEPGGGATIRQLLNHTSGIPDYTLLPNGRFGPMTARAVTTEDVIALLRKAKPDFEPGADYRYNNSGYLLLAAVVENVTGEPWQVALEERITRPLGLDSIRYGSEEQRITARALPYSVGPGGVQLAPAIDMRLASGAGSLVGSVRDLARWTYALHHGEVVSAASYAQMIAPTMLPNGVTVPYGFGLNVEELRGFKAIGHNGAIEGGLTGSIYLPEQDLFVAVFVNSDRPQTMPAIAARRLAAMVAGKPFPELRPVAVDPAALEPLLGVYAPTNGDRIEARFYARDGRLFTQAGEEPEQPVLAAGGDRFFYGPNSLTWLEARRGSGDAVVMELHPNGSDEVQRLARMGPIPPPPVVPRAVLERYIGRYQLEGTVATVGLTEDNQITVQLTGQPTASPLRTVGPNEFAGDAIGVRVSFEGNGPRATTMKTRLGIIVNDGPRLPDGS